MTRRERPGPMRSGGSWPAQEVLDHAHEPLGLLEIGKVPALLEYLPARAGDGLVDLPGGARRDVDVEAAGDHQGGHLERRQHGPHVVLREIGVERLVYGARVAVAVDSRQELVA